jgi:hypothetical protein
MEAIPASVIRMLRASFAVVAVDWFEQISKIATTCYAGFLVFVLFDLTIFTYQSLGFLHRV